MICKFAYQCHIGLLKSYRYFMTYRDMIPLHLTSAKSFGIFPMIAINFNVIGKDEPNGLCFLVALGDFEGGEGGEIIFI